MDDLPTPAPPQPSATVLLVRDDPFEVLMVRRATRARDQFSAALVFPGGVVDPEDRAAGWDDLVTGDAGLTAEERALRIAACRETFEEVGILLADRVVADRPPAASRGFQALVRAAGVRLPLDRLVPFAHWITPAGAPRRFDTHFFLARVPDDAAPVCDGQETVALQWHAPAALCAAAEAGSMPLLFPTRLNLMRLAESTNVADALAAARGRPRFTVEPEVRRRDGRSVVTIPAAAGYGITEDLRGDDRG